MQIAPRGIAKERRWRVPKGNANRPRRAPSHLFGIAHDRPPGGQCRFHVGMVERQVVVDPSVIDRWSRLPQQNIF